MGFLGFLRTSGLVIVSVILAILLLALGTISTLGFSINHENVQKTVPDVLKQTYLTPESQQQMSGNLLQFQLYCNQTNSENVTIPLNNSEFPYLVVPCTEVYKGTNSTVDYCVNQLVNEMYYKDYSCSGVRDCINKNPTYLVSNRFREDLMHYALVFLLISLACFVLVFLLARKKSNACFIIGIITGAVSLLLLIFGNVLKDFLGSLPSSQGISPSSFANIFFSSSTSVFLIFLFFGLAFIITGIFLKVLSIGQVVDDEEEE
ncbi:Uncharacterised protein [uncultured archaeon]|nr:Uncharacterised protein [uncultured archaeon]